MDRRFTGAATGAPVAEAVSGPTTHDIHWAGERRSAIAIAFLLFTALFALDAGLGGLDVTRGIIWTGLAGLIFVILLPRRVSVGPGLLSARGLLVSDTVRTDSLVSVRWSDGIAQRMVLRDSDGNQVEIDPNVLVRNPAMWSRLDTDTRTSLQHGTLLRGTTVLRQLAERLDRETAHTVLKLSGLH
ncbi:hypothetical protein [Streptomyces erythrochromogenes]|uniref:hypothetical protein n=1 Tax=Streptomyces erythrochromogenes TaxID=285574 RepID=UPI0037CEF9F1